MFDKPPITDDTIRACLRESYGLRISAVEFLPLGYDSNAGVYRVLDGDGQPFFLKVKMDGVAEAGVAVARCLRDQGLEAVVAPLPTVTGALWCTVGVFTLLLYPFIEGTGGIDAHLSDRQWIALGAFLRRLHTTALPDDVRRQVRREDFVPNPHWTGIVHRVQATVPTQAYDHPLREAFAAFWRAHHADIDLILRRTEALGARMRQRSPELVLCHADIHTANVLLTPTGALYVVDWDQPVLAPKECDLLFVTVGGFVSEARVEALVLEGYGPAAIDPLSLAYYRYARAVEDAGGFGEVVFCKEDASDETLRSALHWFSLMFAPGNLVDAAHRLARDLSLPGPGAAT